MKTHDLTIGQRIAKMRETRGIKQENIAKTLGISTTSYAKIERNETDVTISRLEEIAKALEVDLWAFFTPQNPIMIVGDISGEAQTINGHTGIQHNYTDTEKLITTLQKSHEAHIADLHKQVESLQKMVEKLIGK